MKNFSRKQYLPAFNLDYSKVEACISENFSRNKSVGNMFLAHEVKALNTLSLNRVFTMQPCWQKSQFVMAGICPSRQ